MFGLSTIKLVAYGIAAVALIGAVFLINSWRLDSNKLKSTQDQLQAEIDCNEHSHCSARLFESATQAQQAAADAKDKAAKENEQHRQEAAQAAKNRAAEDQKKLQAMAKQSADLQKRFESQLIHSDACKAWTEAVIPCDLY